MERNDLYGNENIVNLYDTEVLDEECVEDEIINELKLERQLDENIDEEMQDETQEIQEETQEEAQEEMQEEKEEEEITQLSDDGDETEDENPSINSQETNEKQDIDDGSLPNNADDIPKMVFRKYRQRNSTKIPRPPYKCDQCSKVLSNYSSFKYHMQLHSDSTPYLCSECGQGFKTRNAYDGHMITHADKNPHTCTECGKSYRQAASLRCHMLTHTGETIIYKKNTLNFHSSYLRIPNFFFLQVRGHIYVESVAKE